LFLCDEEGLPPELTPLPGDLIVQGKSDRIDPALGGNFRISGRTGAGMDRLIAAITAALEPRAQGAGTLTRERHRLAVLRAIGAMESARVEVLNGAERAELAAEDLRTAIRALDSLVGRVDVEDLLGEIFASFCIGK
ncbi:tRNA uridine-5-carboxymethylaminomethyl(34) synthesis GTPase MnmE, partial [Thioclava sp. BHET1]